MSGQGRDGFTPVAEQIPFDNDTNGFTSDEVQAAIEEVQDNVDAIEDEYSDGGEARGKDRILGNTDNFDLDIITNNIPRLSIENDGEIKVKHSSNSDFDITFQADSGNSPFGASISKPGASGFMHYMPNSETAQITAASPTAAVGVNRFFLDVDNGGDLYLQTLPGAGESGEIIATDGAPLRPDNDLTSNLGRYDKRWRALYTTGNRIRITQTAHTFTIPSFGFLPVYYNNLTGNYERANANDLATAADALVVDVIDANTFEIQEGGYLNVPLHGLDVGKWYVLRDGLAGLILPLDTHLSENVQYLCFILDENNILLRVDPMFVSEVDGPAISELQSWVQGGTPTIPSGNNRMFILNVHWEDDVANSVASVTVGGVAGASVVSQVVTSGFSNGAHCFMWKEAEIASMGGTAVIVNWNSGVPLSSQYSYATYENVHQTLGTIATNSDSGTGATDTLDADVNAEADGLVIAAAGGGNSGMGFTNNGTGWTRELDITISSADGIVDTKLITSDTNPENVNISITGSNRHVLIACSHRKA